MSLSFAIIGCGNIAKRHAEQIQRVGNLVAVCDIIRSKAEGLGKKYNVEVFSSIEELFANKKEIDIAVICTPNGLHASHSIISLQAGCHVLCEKPMAINSSDCLAMIQEATKAGKHLFVVKQNRFNPPLLL
jgi:predicted dehydrogenase